jgi:hypothetical protein
MILVNDLKSVNFAQLCVRASGASCGVLWLAVRTLLCTVTQVHMPQR